MVRLQVNIDKQVSLPKQKKPFVDTPGEAAVLWLNLQVQLLFLEQLKEQLELELIDHQQWQLNRLRPAGI